MEQLMEYPNTAYVDQYGDLMFKGKVIIGINKKFYYGFYTYGWKFSS